MAKLIRYNSLSCEVNHKANKTLIKTTSTKDIKVKIGDGV